MVGDKQTIRDNHTMTWVWTHEQGAEGKDFVWESGPHTYGAKMRHGPMPRGVADAFIQERRSIVVKITTDAIVKARKELADAVS